MPDYRPFRIATGGVTRDLRAIEKNVDRAGMYVVRDAGRRVKRAARRRVPVYTGRPRQVKSADRTIPLVPGELKDSIASSKRIQRGPRGERVIRVGPRGPHVHLYAAKQEERTHFMAEALAEVAPMVPKIAERAWANATKKGRR